MWLLSSFRTIVVYGKWLRIDYSAELPIYPNYYTMYVCVGPC